MKNKNKVTQTMAEVETKFCSLMDTISLFNNSKAITPINKEQLKQFPFGVWMDLNSKVKVKRRRDRFKEGYLCFDTVMETGGEFGEHFHSDLIESTEVVQGEMYDTYDSKYYREGDVAHYDKGQKHTPIATKKTILHVLFKP
tara:strand:- start:21 stop:446 length:426 start_codon:yes stop_codon:yes gene_type:complete